VSAHNRAPHIFKGEKRMRTGADEHNTEDKKYWCEKYGVEHETIFCDLMTNVLKLPTIINPEKTTNRYAPDLLVNDHLADLKFVGTPFYTSARISNINPQYCVTFDHKDYIRYKTLYPDIYVFFWVKYPDSTGHYSEEVVNIKAMNHVFFVPFSRLQSYIENEGVKYHEYNRRKDDTDGNARGAYLFDVRSFRCLYQGTDVKV